MSLDAGYLSRILRRFESKGWLARVPSPADARQSLLKLTEAGHAVFAPLQQQSRDEAAALLAPLAPEDQHKVVSAMVTVQRLLAGPGEAAATRTVVLRDPRPGDMGWVVQQHGEIYAREYSWNSEFEALVADIAGKYLKNYQPDCEKCWIAELDGERVGSVFVVRKSDTVAQLRLLVVDPKARGLGLGTRLVNECLAFATAAGYESMTLWTQSILTSARAIYARAGFERISEAPHHSFGVDLVGEIWERALRAESPADGPVR